LKALSEWQWARRQRAQKGISMPGDPLTDVEKRVAKLVGLTEQEYLLGKEDSDNVEKGLFISKRLKQIGEDWE